MLRAVETLVSSPDAELFSKVAEGLVAVHENASRLATGTTDVAKAGNLRAARILEVVVKEEAAKYLVLLDAVRCPRQPDSRLRQHLRKFYSHLAKGLYAEVCDWSPVDFKEVRENLEREYDAYYLDGPNDFDWIFRNWIISQREEAFYVDYVKSDSGGTWISPRRYDTDEAQLFLQHVPSVMQLVDALHEAGFSSAPALHIVAEVWRPFVVTDSTHIDELESKNRETLARVVKLGALNQVTPEQARLIITRWPFPLFDLRIEERRVTEAELRAIQEQRYPY